ncbi:HAD family hydrolase [Mesorhizobium sp. ANAO-SY3R2]|uniref:HAD family hydrolase n=1 Tax=Mesorhizobium sp. ANAO-SY3R2 TaxID=3166644 RepID=UPI00366C9DDD
MLVDSEILAAQVTSDTLHSLGLTMSAEEALVALVGLDEAAARRKLEEIHGADLPAAFEAEMATRLDHAFNTQLQPIAGIADLLEGLRLPFCVASNSTHERLRRTFAVTGLAPLVEGRVFSADDVKRGKPAPDLFLLAAKTMGGFDPSRCLVIEDSLTGVTAARAAGMHVIGFCGGGHILPGHDQRLRALGADPILTHHHQIAAHPWLADPLPAVATA